MFGQQFETMGAFVARRDDLPSFADQEAFMRGEKQWTAPVRRRAAVDYGSDPVAWFAVRANPRCEDRATEALLGAGFDAFFPKGRKLIVHHRTRKRVEREYPLMSGYLLLAMPDDARCRHWGRVRECDGVAGVLGSEGTPRALPIEAVETIREAEAGDRLIFDGMRRRGEQTIHSFAVGGKARIAVGPLAGFVGEIVDLPSRKAVRILLSVFGRMTEIDIPVDGAEWVS